MLVLVCTFKVSGMLYQWNNDRLLAAFQAVQEEPALFEEAKEASLASEIPPEGEDGEGLIIMEDTGIILGDNEQNNLMKDLWSFNGRTQIWEATLKAVRNDRSLKIWGTEYSGTIISIYHWFDVDHAHNSWLETALCLGLPGLVFTLVFTVLAVFCIWTTFWGKDIPLEQKVIAVLALCLLGAGILEPYLFFSDIFYHYTDFIFFLCLGYLIQWRSKAA